jgi:hypothetical protein
MRWRSFNVLRKDGKMTQVTVTENEAIVPYVVHLVCCKDDDSPTFCGKDSMSMVPARDPDGPLDVSCAVCLAHAVSSGNCPNGGQCTGD